MTIRMACILYICILIVLYYVYHVNIREINMFKLEWHVHIFGGYDISTYKCMRYLHFLK
jgi:hypothetical protein